MTDISNNKRVNDFLATQGTSFINKEFVDALAGRTFATPNLATVADAHAEDVDAAVQAARAAYEGSWSSLTPSQRGKLL